MHTRWQEWFWSTQRTKDCVVGIGDKKTLRLGDGAKGISIPAPREELGASDKPTVRAEDLPEELKILDPLYKILPPDEQKMHLWAQLLPAVYDAENSETEWSGEYFAKWLATQQAGTLGHDSFHCPFAGGWRI